MRKRNINEMWKNFSISPFELFLFRANMYFTTKNYSKMISNIISVDEVLVRPEIADTKFVCDLKKCKGACCTLESEFGAPLADEEVKIINDILHIVKKYLPEEHIKEIEKNEFFVRKDGELMTQTVDRKACVFVYYEEDIAKCGIEKAFNNKEIDFRKPISCHLFPIRVSKFGGEVLRYEKFTECGPALQNGDDLQVTIAEFCKDALVRSYGHNWYSSFMKRIGK